MMSDSKEMAFTAVGRLNHWIVSIAFMFILVLGWLLYFEIVNQAAKSDWRNLHKAMGTLILLFGIWRVGYRLALGFPQSVADISPRQALLAKSVHYLLLLAIVLIPASGFAKSWFAGYPVDMFGLFSIGSPNYKNESVADIASTVHFAAGIVVTMLIILHIAGALKHHFIDRDATLTRMVRG